MTLNRDQLKYEDGIPVQFDGWADAFRMNIPERIAREMREQVIDLDADLDEYGKKLMSNTLSGSDRSCFASPTKATSAQRRFFVVDDVERGHGGVARSSIPAKRTRRAAGRASCATEPRTVRVRRLR
jgi:hypothetical protein